MSDYFIETTTGEKIPLVPGQFSVNQIDELLGKVANEDVGSGVFWAEFGVTTLEEVTAAAAAGKVCAVKIDYYTYYLSLLTEYSARFTFVNWTVAKMANINACEVTANGWVTVGMSVDSNENKVQAISDTDTAANYPSSPAVQTYVGEQLEPVAVAADNAQTAADNAQAAADNAQTAADNAQTAADNAQTAADNAQAAADNAQTAADNAQASADKAQHTADSAQTAADNAQTLADEAQKDADAANALALGAYVTPTTSGAIASLDDGADGIPVKSLVVGIEPVQSGSGDPSPDNVRPISGWTGANVQRVGKNIAELNIDTAQDGTFSVTKTDTVIDAYPGAQLQFVSNRTPSWGWRILFNGVRGVLFPNTSYTVSFLSNKSDAINLLLTETNGSNALSNGRQTTVESVGDGVYRHKAVLTTYSGDNESWNSKNQNVQLYLPAFSASSYEITIGAVQVAFGAGDGVYEPYQGETYAISFPTEAGTVYGGTLDVTSGVLTVDRAMVDLGTLTWYYDETGSLYVPYFRATIDGLGVKYEGAFSTTYNLLCSQYKTAAKNSSFVDGCVIADGSADAMRVLELRIKDSRFTDASLFSATLVGVQLVYELARPITYQLTPTEVTTLLGVNNIYADTGDSSVTYRADPTLIYNKLTAAIISSGGTV